MTDTVEVVAGVIERSDGSFLLASRPDGKSFAGYWEFPGGKIESGELPYEALARELHEELGISVLLAYPWIHRYFRYPHANVAIHFYRVRSWQGTPSSLEGQVLSWCSHGEPLPGQILPANSQVLAALSLPQYYALTHFNDPADPLSMESFISGLEHGIRLVLIREPWVDESERIRLARALKPIAEEKSVRLLFHGTEALARASEVGGIHLNSHELMKLEERPDFPLCAASVHNPEEMKKAADLELDFVMLSPVAKTKSHPEKGPLGWTSFSQIISDCPLPVFALGGLSKLDLDSAMEAGAHGVAMQRAIWF